MSHGRRWISAFLEAQAAELGAAQNTLHAYARDLSDFDAWLTNQGHSMEKADQHHVEAYLVHCDAQGLARATRAHGRSPADRARNTCLMELLYATGMRVSELVSLPVAAARGNPQMLLIRGKGGKERMVPLSPDARDVMVEWLKLRD